MFKLEVELSIIKWSKKQSKHN